MPPTDTPKVSIVLPVYNGSRFLADAIESVMNQSYSSWELLVVDDCSTDATPAMVAKRASSEGRIKHLRNEKNLGLQKTLNRGLAAARGEYIARIDDDDMWVDRDKLAAQVAFLSSNPDHLLVGTGAIVADEAGTEQLRYRFPGTDRAIRHRFLFRNCFVHSSVLFRREDVIKLGGYAESPAARNVEDYDLWLRLGRNGKLANLESYSVLLRWRDGSISAENKGDQLNKDLAFVIRYRRCYPRGNRAVAFGIVRIAGHRFFRLLPRAIQGRLFRLYKQH